MSLSTIFQLHRGSLYYWWMKTEYLEKTTHQQQRRYFKMEQVDLIIEVNDIHVLVIEGCHGCDHTEVAYHH
jgi:hypothetical protein